MGERLNFDAASPRGMQAFGGVQFYIVKSGLPSTLINLVYLRVSQINRCSYCISTHARDLMEEGVSVQKLLLLPGWRDAGDLFSKRERAALHWAEVLARIAQTHAPDADYEIVRAEFADKELADLTYAIALVGAYNRIGIAFGRRPDRSFLQPGP
jgi:AhpD family alkylhydroperoxidase